ncbi:MAG TPA: oligosaccharide flippase family protein [Spirochaetota bacterium]|nr:oligosaccharide flippase family protein [Spirochaetota bacterium]HPR47785.1 oligosaccharide flippase family protein [Spirochaetota bacterium]
MLKKNIIKIITHYSTFIKSKTAKSYAIILSGNILTAVFGMISSIIIARVLGPEIFGLFSIALAIQLVVLTIIDFGFTKGLVSLLANNDYKNVHADIFASSFYFRMIFSSIILAIGMLTAELISKKIFNSVELIRPLKITYLIIFFAGIWGILQLGLQASEKFKYFASSKVISAIAKLLLILILYYISEINLVTALLTFLLSFIFGALYSFKHIDNNYFSLNRFKFKTLNLVLKINKWIVYVNLFYILSGRISIFMLSTMTGAKNAGIYNAAFNIINGISLFLESISTVLLPQISNIKSYAGFKKYLVRSFSISLPLIICCGIGLLFAKPIILMIYGVNYFESSLVLIPLLVWFIISLLVEPVILLSYGLNRPDIVFYSNFIYVVLIIILNLYFIPLYQAQGSAFSLIISKFISSSINIIWICIIIKKNFSNDTANVIISKTGL